METRKGKNVLPEPATVDLRPQDYQPTKAELGEEFDLPAISKERMRKAFFRPLKRDEKAS